MSRKTVVALALALLLAPALLLAADGKGHPSPDQILHNPRLLAKYLQLTPDQVAKAQPLFQQLGTTLKGIGDQGKPLHDQLHTLLAGNNPNACDVGAVVVQIDSLRDQAHAALEAFDTAFSALLTPEQLAKYEALKDAAHVGDDDAAS